MKEHCVAATQNWVGQLHWKIDGHVWRSTHGKKGHIHPEERKIWFRESAIFASHK